MSQEGTYTLIMYYVWWDYFNHFNTRANISQPHSSLFHPYPAVYEGDSPHIQQLQKYSTLLRVLVNNMMFTEEEREKWIHMLILSHWSHSIILQWVLHPLERHNSYWKHSLCKEKQSKAFAESKFFLFKYADFIIITLSFKM